MGFWDKVSKVAKVAIEKTPDMIRAIEQEGQRVRVKQEKEMERKITTYERQIIQKEKAFDTLSHQQRKQVIDQRDKLNRAKATVYGTTDTNRVKTLAQWDREWISIGKLIDAHLTPYNHSVGLYRHVVKGKTVYVGRAIELHNGGFRKRLSDYRRESNSARKHQSGKLIHQHLADVETFLLVVGDDEEAVQITKALEGKFIGKYAPSWNKVKNI